MPTRDTELRKIYEELAVKHRKPVEVIEEVVRSMFTLARREMNNNEREDPESFKNVRLPYIGSFLYDSRKQYKIQEVVNKQKKKKT